MTDLALPGSQPPLKRVLVVVHKRRPQAGSAARTLLQLLAARGIDAVVTEQDRGAFDGTEWNPGVVDVDGDFDMVIVLGGDGTILRGAGLARAADVPLFGVNLGRVGFLAEAEPSDLEEVIDGLVAGQYRVVERLTVDAAVYVDDVCIDRAWALNECSLEKADRQRLIDVLVEVGGRPLSQWGTDGVLLSTPTGSTAYAFSAGGPILWPNVDAFLVVPLLAHALFNRPVVVPPDVGVTMHVLGGKDHAVLWADSRRLHAVPAGARVEFTRGARPVKLARLHSVPFANRLVAKFNLPIEGWRGNPDGTEDGGWS